MGGRAGSAANRDVLIAVLTAAGTVLSFGFLVNTVILLLLLGCAIKYNLFLASAHQYFPTPQLCNILLAGSHSSGCDLRLLHPNWLPLSIEDQRTAGCLSGEFPYWLHSIPIQSNQFPFRFQQVRNMFYEYDGTLSKDESGYLFSFQDRREERPLLGTKVDLTGLVSIKSKCETEMMCGMPLYDYRFTKSKLQSKWLPRSEPIVPPEIKGLELLNKTILNATNVRFEFNLTGPSHMSLFIQPYDNVKISNWSYNLSYLDMPSPFHIYLTYGIDNSPYNFFVEASVIKL